MKKFNKTISKLLIVVFALLVSCENFEDINSNPDTVNKASASMVATKVILDVVKFGGRDAHAYLQPNALSKYLGFANQSQMGSQYNSFSHGGFGSITILPNIEAMLEYAQGSPMENSYNGIAKFARAYTFFQLTMEMGDIPYSETNQGAEGGYRPKYDPQEQVFIGILNELKEADAFFAQGVKFDGDPTPYAGDPDKWRRASNSFALKVLMSLSKKADVASLNVKGRFSEIVSKGFIFEPSTGYLGLQYSSVNQHPMATTSIDLFIKRTVISSLLIDNLKKLNDKRLFYFADPAPDQIAKGYNETQDSAYVGADVAMPYSDLTKQYLKGAYSILNVRYAEPIVEPRMMLTYGEQQLVLAEARIRGWITAGTAKEYYESGVKSALSAMTVISPASVHGNPITQDYIDNYFTGEAAFKATTDEQLKQIWLQRYFLNFMQDSESSYFEYRRTGYPEFPINPNTNLNEDAPNKIPVRWLYPNSETNYNRENLIEALNRQFDGYDEVNKIMWLLK